MPDHNSKKNAELKHHNNSYKICDNKLNCFRIYTSPHLAFQHLYASAVPPKALCLPPVRLCVHA